MLLKHDETFCFENGKNQKVEKEGMGGYSLCSKDSTTCESKGSNLSFEEKTVKCFRLLANNSNSNGGRLNDKSYAGQAFSLPKTDKD